jgi:hypothetical protein
MTIGRRSHSGAREIIVIAQRERESRSSGFSPMAPLRGGATEMTTRRRSIDVASGASMERWF